MAGDAEEKARRHRNGQKVSDEAELEDAGANENEPDCETERRGGCRIMLWPRRREHRKRAGENRRDGRIGADRKAPAVAKKREPDRGGDKSKQADLRREVGETGGRHLRGNGDSRQRQAGDHVGAEVAGSPAGERAQNEPGAPSAKGGGEILFARPCHLIRHRNAADSPADLRPGGAQNFAAASLPNQIHSAPRSAWWASACRRAADGPPRHATARSRAPASGTSRRDNGVGTFARSCPPASPGGTAANPRRGVQRANCGGQRNARPQIAARAPR